MTVRWWFAEVRRWILHWLWAVRIALNAWIALSCSIFNVNDITKALFVCQSPGGNGGGRFGPPCPPLIIAIHPATNVTCSSANATRAVIVTCMKNAVALSQSQAVCSVVLQTLCVVLSFVSPAALFLLRYILFHFAVQTRPFR